MATDFPPDWAGLFDLGAPEGVSDSADYGGPTPEEADPAVVRCRACGRPVGEHAAGRFSVHGVCPEVTS